MHAASLFRREEAFLKMVVLNYYSHLLFNNVHRVSKKVGVLRLDGCTVSKKWVS